MLISMHNPGGYITEGIFSQCIMGVLIHLCYHSAIHNRYRYRLIFDACEQMDKEYVVCINNGVLFNYKE